MQSRIEKIASYLKKAIRPSEIVRIKNLSKETDIFVFLMDALEKDKTSATTILGKAWDYIAQGKSNMGVKAIINDTNKFVKKISDKLKAHVLKNVDSTMLVNDPKFLSSAGNIMAYGVMNEMKDNPMHYLKLLPNNFQKEIDDYVIERGKSKFLNMLDNKGIR